MKRPVLEAVTVKGYTSIRDAQVRLGPLNVLVGANGSGKSNFVSALELLGRIGEERLQESFYQRGFTDLLHDRRTDRIELGAQTATNAYRVALAATRDDRPVIDEEVTWYRSSPSGDWTSEEVLGRGRPETALHQRVAQKGYRSVETYVLEMLRGCRVYHFHDTSESAWVKWPGTTADNLELKADAANLAAVLRVIRDRAPATYRQILGTVRLVAPFFGDLVLEPEGASDKVRLRWRHADSDRVFSAHELSDGTLRFLSLATLLLDTARLPAVVVLDEPELGLHPFAIAQLAELLRAASVNRQVVVATQSVPLVDHLELGDLIVVDREHGASHFKRPDEGELRAWLDEYSLGDLWQKSLIGGRPTPETG